MIQISGGAIDGTVSTTTYRRQVGALKNHTVKEIRVADYYNVEEKVYALRPSNCNRLLQPGKKELYLKNAIVDVE